VKKLINEPLGVVDDLLSSLVAGWPHLAHLDGQRVILRSDIDTFKASGRVALVSGGGSGHEPAHAGFVGEGMLTAAVCGDIFTSPPTDAVLAAIRAVASPAGVLLIIKNYTGDRLNFKLAAEAARAEGIAVESVIVSDDVALAASTENAGRRGIAGTVLVHKIAGAAAAAGLPLAEVAALARSVAERVGTMGVALSACTVPAAGKPNFTLGDGEMELGLGIHGEPGVQRAAVGSAKEIAEKLIDAIVSDRRLVAGTPVALLVNNLGATPPIELAIVTGEALQALARRGVEVKRLWSGALLTALDMAGVSISVLPLGGRFQEFLDADTAVAAWPQGGTVERSFPASVAVPAPAAAMSGGGTPLPVFHDGLAAVLNALIDAEGALTELDRLSGDGDLGTNLARGARAVLARRQALAALSPAAALKEISGIFGTSVGGTSGALYAAGLMRASRVVGDGVDAKDWANALSEAGAAVADIGDARAGDRTMLDSLLPAAEALSSNLTKDSGRLALKSAVEAAAAGAVATAGMMSRRGRSSYLGERVVGNQDAGAAAVVVWLTALSTALEAAN
jgi:dihydroxyacetone kinase